MTSKNIIISSSSIVVCKQLDGAKIYTSYIGFSSNTLYAKIKRICTKKDEMFQALNQRGGVWHHCYLNLGEAEEHFTLSRLHTLCSSLQSKVTMRERKG
jgi:hypothetical protein